MGRGCLQSAPLPSPSRLCARMQALLRALERVLRPAPLTASFPLPFPLAFSLSVSVFLFSRKSVRGKGKGQKRKRKKSRYKSWSAYVVPLPSHSPARSLPGPQSNSHLQDPRAPPAPRPLPGSRPPSSGRLSLTLTPLIGTGGRRGGGITSPGGRREGGQSGPTGFREGVSGLAGAPPFPSPTGHWWRAHVGTGARHRCLLTQLVSTALGFRTSLEAGGRVGRADVA